MARVFFNHVKIKDEYLNWVGMCEAYLTEERFKAVIEAVPNEKVYSKNMREIRRLSPLFDEYVRRGGDPFIYINNRIISSDDFYKYHELTSLML